MIGRASTFEFWFDHVDIEPILAVQDGSGRDGGRVLEDLCLHANINELARPELIVLVSKYSLEPNRSGCRIDAIVNQRKRALGNFADGILLKRPHLYRACPHCTLDVR